MTHATASIGQTPWRTEIKVNGRTIVADEPETLGGQGAGLAPYDLLLASLGACTAITLKMYAARKGWEIEELSVELELKGGKGELRIDRTLVIAGLNEEQAARLADIAERTPVTLTLKNGISIDTHLG